MQKKHLAAAVEDAAMARERAHRLEIAVGELKERLDRLEGSHESLSHSVRGRLGGRGNKAQVAQAPLYLVPPAM